MANKIYVNNIIEKTGGGAVVAGSNVSYTVPSNSAANIGSVDNIKTAIDWILINWPSNTVPTVKTLSSISWTDGSINPTSVTSGKTVTLTKGTITANYSDGTTANVTNSTSFTVNNGASINGTTITAPTVTTNTTVTVTAQYTENGVSKTAAKTFSVTASVQEISISINKSSLTIPANGSATIVGTISPSSTSNKNINWSASPTGIVTISPVSSISGNEVTITWKAAGSTTLTAESAADNTKKATCTIICEDVPQPIITYYTYIGADSTYKIVDEDGYLTSNAANNLPSMTGIVATTSKPTSINDAYPAGTSIPGNNNFIYIIALDEILPFNQTSNSPVYLKTPNNNNVNMDEIGTFILNGNTYKVLSTRSTMSNAVVQ